MSDAQRISEGLSRHLSEQRLSLSNSKFWLQSIKDYQVISYYIAQHPDLKLSGDSQLTLSIITESGFHGINFKRSLQDEYVYCPLNKIEWIREYKTLDRNSYIVSIQIPKSNFTVSDYTKNEETLRTFAHILRKQVEVC